MIDIKKWVERPIEQVVKEKIKLLLMEDVDIFRKSAHMSDNDQQMIVEYLYEWIDLCCAYTSSCDIIDIYFMSLDGMDRLRLEEAINLFNDEAAVKIIRDKIRPHPGRQGFLNLCRNTYLRDLGYLKLLRDLFGTGKQTPESEDDIDHIRNATNKIIKKGGSSNVNTDND